MNKGGRAAGSQWKSVEGRFWERVRKTERGCWEFPWSGKQKPGVSYKGDRWVASRLAYFLVHGPIPSGMHVCHKCDNPPCINPDHLFLGTHQDNMRDMIQKGRGSKPPQTPHKGELSPVAKLTEQQVREIRATYKPYVRGHYQSDLAKRFGVSRGTISSIIRRENWSHVA